MAQKIIQIGSSVGITLPQPIMAGLGLHIGDPISLKAHPDSASITISVPRKKEASSNIKVDPAILQWTNEFIEKNRMLLERLADK